VTLVLVKIKNGTLEIYYFVLRPFVPAGKRAATGTKHQVCPLPG
jgi:hypothetical protein